MSGAEHEGDAYFWSYPASGANMRLACGQGGDAILSPDGTHAD
jgi:hypothetical protein